MLAAARYGRHSRPALQEVQQRIAELTAEAEESISGIRVVKAFAREEERGAVLAQASGACSTRACSPPGCAPSTTR